MDEWLHNRAEYVFGKMIQGSIVKCTNPLIDCEQQQPGTLSVFLPAVLLPFQVPCAKTWQKLPTGDAICCTQSNSDCATLPKYD